MNHWASSYRLITFVMGMTIVLSPSCASRRADGMFRVLPASPNYLLRSPDLSETPLPEVLNRYASADPGSVDLRRGMELRIEQAYFRDGAPSRRIGDYLGTEVAQYEVRGTGQLRLAAVESTVAQRPVEQPEARRLMSRLQRRYRYHRFFWQVAFSQTSGEQRAVLLGAGSSGELKRLVNQLITAPDFVCGADSVHCTVFPESCTVSLEIAIRANGVRRTILWGSRLASVAVDAVHIELLRNHGGRLHLVQLDPNDPEALRLPLLPGDQLNWR